MQNQESRKSKKKYMVTGAHYINLESQKDQSKMTESCLPTQGSIQPVVTLSFLPAQVEHRVALEHFSKRDRAKGDETITLETLL
jgi:hypothetical protein